MDRKRDWICDASAAYDKADREQYEREDRQITVVGLALLCAPIAGFVLASVVWWLL
jgi:hypothetical protein